MIFEMYQTDAPIGTVIGKTEEPAAGTRFDSHFGNDRNPHSG
jgi:hypothetical protein